MSERAIAEGLRDVVQGLPSFQTASVSLDDRLTHEVERDSAPFFWMMTSENVEAVYVYNPVTEWTIPAMLVVAFSGWNETYSALRDLRQEILDVFNVRGSVARSANGIDGVHVQAIRAQTPILPLPLTAESEQELPIFLFQVMEFIVEETAQ